MNTLIAVLVATGVITLLLLLPLFVRRGSDAEPLDRTRPGVRQLSGPDTDPSSTETDTDELSPIIDPEDDRQPCPECGKPRDPQYKFCQHCLAE